MAEEMRINRVNNGWHVVRYGQGGRVGCTEQHVFQDTNEGRMGLSDWVVGWIAETSEAPSSVTVTFGPAEPEPNDH